MTKSSITDTFMDMRLSLRRLAGRILRSDAEVDDALQDAFVRMWQSADEKSTWQNSRGAMVTILRNVCIDKLRRRQNLPHDELDERVYGMTDNRMSDRVEGRDMVENVARLAADRLKGAVRRAFEMYVLEECDYTEIASELGISVEVARSYVCRGRKTIRELIKGTL